MKRYLCAILILFWGLHALTLDATINENWRLVKVLLTDRYISQYTDSEGFWYYYSFFDELESANIYSPDVFNQVDTLTTRRRYEHQSYGQTSYYEFQPWYFLAPITEGLGVIQNDDSYSISIGYPLSYYNSDIMTFTKDNDGRFISVECRGPNHLLYSMNYHYDVHDRIHEVSGFYYRYNNNFDYIHKVLTYDSDGLLEYETNYTVIDSTTFVPNKRFKYLYRNAYTMPENFKPNDMSGYTVVDTRHIYTFPWFFNGFLQHINVEVFIDEEWLHTSTISCMMPITALNGDISYIYTLGNETLTCKFNSAGIKLESEYIKTGSYNLREKRVYTWEEYQVENPPDPLPIVGDIGVSVAPNPFNPETKITIELPVSGEARIEIYNQRGQLTKTLAAGFYQTGKHSFVFDGKDSDGKTLASGVYVVRVNQGKRIKTSKLVLIK